METTGKSVPPSLTTHRSLVPSDGLPGTICVTVPVLPLYLPAVIVTLEPPVMPAGFAATAGAFLPALAAGAAFLAGAGAAGLAARALISVDALTAARFSSSTLGLGAALGAAGLAAALGAGLAAAGLAAGFAAAGFGAALAAGLAAGFAAAFGAAALGAALAAGAALAGAALAGGARGDTEGATPPAISFLARSARWAEVSGAFFSWATSRFNSASSASILAPSVGCFWILGFTIRAGGSFARIAFSSALARSARWADVSGAALDAAAFLGAASDVTGRAAGAARATGGVAFFTGVRAPVFFRAAPFS
mmetsp:Transcript_38714/g.91029  ORF Transcript_38714/g.91029 Transcript_38714/m.91029 type:complete len:308 (-) Transcript_38714:204-1127(-)